jgi:hypothetical protein
VAKAIRELKHDKGRNSERSARSAEWSESEDNLLFRGKIYVLKDLDLRL